MTAGTLAKYYKYLSTIALPPARRATGMMHRALWPAGVTDQRTALLQVSFRVERTLAGVLVPDGRPALLADLGCGVGGTAVWLARRHAVRVAGVTLSPEQATAARTRMAGAHVRTPEMRGQAVFALADFHNLPLGDGTCDGAYAIESFAHSPDPARFFAEALRVLRLGGRLVVVDDVLAEPGAGRPDADGADWVRRFAQGWHLPSLLPAAAIGAHAVAAGFRAAGQDDLSALVPRLRRRRLVRLLARWPFGRQGAGGLGDALRGSMACAVAHDGGWVGYRLFAFDRPA